MGEVEIVPFAEETGSLAAGCFFEGLEGRVGGVNC